MIKNSSGGKHILERSGLNFIWVKNFNIFYRTLYLSNILKAKHLQVERNRIQRPQVKYKDDFSFTNDLIRILNQISGR